MFHFLPFLLFFLFDFSFELTTDSTYMYYSIISEEGELASGLEVEGGGRLFHLSVSL